MRTREGVAPASPKRTRIQRFPRVEAACVEITDTREWQHELRCGSFTPRMRNALIEARRAYADELLPALFGGSWKWLDYGRTRGALSMLGSHGVGMGRGLLDHGITFRPVGLRGNAAKERSVFIGMPYYAFDDDGDLSDGAKADATAWRQRGFGVWARPDLSAWYPGSTNLVLIAAALLYRSDAADFGFQAIL